MRAAYKYCEKQEYRDVYNSSVALMLREMQRKANTERPFESRLLDDYSTNKQFSELRSASDLHWCFAKFLSWSTQLGPRIMRKLRSNTRERTQ